MLSPLKLVDEMILLYSAVSADASEATVALWVLLNEPLAACVANSRCLRRIPVRERTAPSAVCKYEIPVFMFLTP